MRTTFSSQIQNFRATALQTFSGFAFALTCAPLVFAQSAAIPQSSGMEMGLNASSAITRALPDAPSVTAALKSVPSEASSSEAMLSGSIFTAPDPSVPASKYQKYILPGQTAPHLGPGDKVALGFRDAVSPFALVGIAASAGYSHLTNGSPNYGTNSTAFAQRFGAAAARDTSEGLFTDCIMANVFREDPRYYEMGDGHNFLVRAAYAATRVVVTRTDGGRTSPNLALLSGYAGAAAMTNLYYPQLNRGFNQSMQTFGGSLGGAAIGNIVDEFIADTLQFVHLQKR